MQDVKLLLHLLEPGPKLCSWLKR